MHYREKDFKNDYMARYKKGEIVGNNKLETD